LFSFIGYYFFGVKIIALILSDVIGDPLEFIASGPTFYSGNKNQPALDIFNKYDLIDHIPAQFLQHLKENAENTSDQTM
jgi:glycerate-2-kinase